MLNSKNNNNKKARDKNGWPGFSIVWRSCWVVVLKSNACLIVVQKRDKFSTLQPLLLLVAVHFSCIAGSFLNAFAGCVRSQGHKVLLFRRESTVRDRPSPVTTSVICSTQIISHCDAVVEIPSWVVAAVNHGAAAIDNTCPWRCYPKVGMLDWTENHPRPWVMKSIFFELSTAKPLFVHKSWCTFLG